MKRLVLGLLIILALVGCSPNEPPQVTPIPCPEIVYLGDGTFQAKFYEVDPNYYSTTSDGWWEAYDAAGCYTTAWTAASGTVSHTGSSQVGQYLDAFAWYYIDRGGLFFDTSAIAGGIVTGASLNLYGASDSSTTDFDLTLQTGGATYPHDPMQTTDYNKSYYSGNGGSKTTSGWNTAGYNEIALSSSGMSWIDTSGTTKFMVRSSRDIAGTIPAFMVDERVSYYDGGCGNISRTPYLSVNYTCGDWLDDYTYRKMFAITGSTAGAQTNYQMRVNVYAAAGTDSGSSVYLNYTTQTDFDDVRFTTPSGTSLDFWQESYTSNVSAVFWVECDSIAASPSVTSFLMYYGNSAATSGSNGDNTFIFFDDFSGSFPGTKWTGDTGLGTVAGGILTCAGNGAWRAIRSATGLSSNEGAVRAYGAVATAGTVQSLWGLRGVASANHRAEWYSETGTSPYKWLRSMDGSSYSDVATNFTAGLVYKTWDLIVRGGTNSRGVENGDELLGSPKTTYPPNASDMSIIIATYTNTATIYRFDWILLRKYAYPEPSISSWGSQNTLPAPTGVSATDGTYTDKVIVSWTEPCGASGYYLYRGGTYVTSVASGTTSYNDTGATAGSVDCGTPLSTPNIGYVTITTVGEQAINASPVAYTLKSYAGTVNSTSSSSNTGFRSVGAISYQWQYWNGTAYANIPGGTTDPYDDYTYAPTPYIYPGTMQASTTNTSSVALSVSGEYVVTGATNSSLVQWYRIVVSGEGDGTAAAQITDAYKLGGALNYQLWRSATDADSDFSNLTAPTTVENYYDTDYPSAIFPGTAVATDDTYSDKVALSVTGSNVTTYPHYYFYTLSATGTATINSTHTQGYQSYGTPAYQWYRSASTSPSDYSVLSGATTASWDDTTAPAGVITPGSADATDGTSSFNITISLVGSAVTDGEARYYLREMTAAGTTSQNSTADSGYRNAGPLLIQLMRSAGDSDDNYSDIVGVTSSPYVDTDVPLPTITPGTAVASDGTYTDYVYVYLSGASFNDGEGRYYKWAETADGATSLNSTSDRGHTGIGTPQYQWQRTSDDEDWGFSNMTGAVSAALNDTTAPAGTIGDALAIASDAEYVDKVTLSLFGGATTNGSRRYFRCVLNGLGATEQTSSSNRGFRGIGNATYQWFISAADSDADYSSITSPGLTDYAYNTTNGVFYPDGRFYLAAILADGATDKNATADRGNFYSNVSGCGVSATITSDSSSSITFSSALLSGNISDVGCSNVTLRGFQWGTASGCYTGASYDIGDFGTGLFDYTASDLSPVTTYFWRAYGMNGNGTAYGGELNFTTLNVTLPLPPTDFTATQVGGATTNGTYSVNLTWTMGVNATRTIIRSKDGGYPANLTDGNFVYNGTGTWLLLAGLSLDTVTYGYSAWGENPLGDSLDHARAQVGTRPSAGIILVIGLCAFSIWKRGWIRVLLALSVVTWGVFAMTYDIKVAAPLLAVGTILFFMGILPLIKHKGEEVA